MKLVLEKHMFLERWEKLTDSIFIYIYIYIDINWVYQQINL